MRYKYFSFPLTSLLKLNNSNAGFESLIIQFENVFSFNIHEYMIIIKNALKGLIAPNYRVGNYPDYSIHPFYSHFRLSVFPALQCSVSMVMPIDLHTLQTICVIVYLMANSFSSLWIFGFYIKPKN